MARLVTDAVWAQLNPDAGRLSRATARRMTAAVCALAMMLAVGALLSRSGLVVARLSWDRYVGGFKQSIALGRIEHGVKVRNDGWVAVTVLGAGRDMPGMTLVEVGSVFPFVLAPGETREFTATYQVSDCAAISREAWPFPLRVRHWWGEQTTYIEVPKEVRDAVDGVFDPAQYEVEWQYDLGATACGW